MTQIILFNKPCGVISQFSPSPPHQTLKDYIEIAGVYPAGRLDNDSEGLMILTDDGRLQAQISEPKHNKSKTYWAQVEGAANEEQVLRLQQGVLIGDYQTKPAMVKLIDEPSNLWERNPPIRFRKHIPTSWLSITLFEGKNRQVRRMTAAVGLPTLRLIRVAIGGISLGNLGLGKWGSLSLAEFNRQFNQKSANDFIG